MSLFTVNARNVLLHHFNPKHGKAEDAPRSAELQFRNIEIKPSAAAALLLAEGDGKEVEESFFMGDHFVQRFFGIAEIRCTATFANRHMMIIDDLGEIRVAYIDKIRLRLEGGPQRLIWMDCYVHVEDPSPEEVDFYHDKINRSVSLRLNTEADLVDQMRAEVKGMAVSTIQNGELDLDAKAERDADQLQQAADGLSGSAEIPLKTKRGQRKPAAKKSPKAKKKAA